MNHAAIIFMSLSFVFFLSTMIILSRFLDFIHHIDDYMDARILDLSKVDTVRYDEMKRTKTKIEEYKKHITKA